MLIWANQPIYSFLVGSLNPCLQGTSVRVASSHPLCVLCWFWVLVLVSVFTQVGPGLDSFSSFLLFEIMCVRYLIAIWEKDSISLWIMELGICRSWRTLIVVAYIMPFFSCCDYNGW